MTQELQKQEQQIGELTQEHIDTLTKAGVIPKNTPEPQVKLFAEICREKKLSPFSRQIHLVKRYDKNNGETYTAQTGIDGYRAIANRTGQYAGSDEPLYDEGLTAFQMEDKGRKQPRTATVTVYKLVSGQRIPFTSTVRWAEFYPGEKMGFMWKKMPFSQLAKCFDPNTEVLTTDGFQRFDSVTGRIFQVTDRGLQPCDAKPFWQAYEGEMICANGTRLNFMVTPNHDMVTSDDKIEAQELYKNATSAGEKFSIPRCPPSSNTDYPISDNELRLIGYFLADGSHTGHKQFRIVVSKGEKIEVLREIALHEKESVKKDAGKKGFIDGREITTYQDKTAFTYRSDLISWLVTSEKALKAENLLKLSQQQARTLVDAVVEFDGHINKSGIRRLSQSNQNVINAFEIASVHAGYSVSSPYIRQNGGEVLTISETPHFPVVRNVPKNSASLVKRKNVEGIVWCVSVPSGVIVVRRHGFSMLCGNCSESQALRKAFPEEIGGVYTEEEMQQAEAGANQEQKEKTEENLKAVVQDAQQSEDVEQAEQSDEPSPEDEDELTDNKSKTAYEVAIQAFKDCETYEEMKKQQKSILQKAYKQGLKDGDKNKLFQDLYEIAETKPDYGEQESIGSQSTKQSGQDQS